MIQQYIKELEKIIKKDKLIDFCANGIRLQDDRLVDHGERVAYIAYKIYQEYDKQNLNNRNLNTEKLDIKMLLLLSIFHDIGAYKTEEIDRMVEFETQNINEHSIFGYLFLKFFSPWKEWSEVILYHHSSCERINPENCKFYYYSTLIHIADRIDIGIYNGLKKEQIISSLKSPVFNQEYVNVIDNVFENTDVIKTLISKDMSDVKSCLKEQINITFRELFSLIKMLVYSIDFKSEATVLHSINTAIIATYLANYNQFSKDEVGKIYLASLIHDIGKLAIPNSILEKPGKLTDEEMLIMKEHVMYTKQLMMGVFPDDIIHIAVRHHEKLDGTGYPEGLTGNQLLLSERIVAVSDILSALISRRSYKKEFGKEKTIEILKEMVQNDSIDANLVAIVEENIDDLLQCIQTENKKVIQIYTSVMQEYQQILEFM